MKTEKAENFIRTRMMMLTEGQPLPPVRFLVAESGCTRYAISAATDKFCKQGFLMARDRSGIYRTGKMQHNGHNTIDIIACDVINYLTDPHSFFNDFLENFMLHLTNAGKSARIHKIGFDRDLNDYEELLSDHNITQCVLLNPANPMVPAFFSSLSLPHVTLFPRYFPISGNVIIDDPQIIDLQINKLLEDGHEKILFIHEVYPDSYAIDQVLRRERFFQLMAYRGIAVNPDWVISASNRKSHIKSKLERIWGLPQKPTAIACGSVSLTEVYEFFKENKVKVGRDIALIGTGRKEYLHLNPQPDLVYTPLDLLSEKILKMLDSFSMNKDNIEYVPLVCCHGQTLSKRRMV
jgi:DNA-binding LacI/PurR family transcriptional regulator